MSGLLVPDDTSHNNGTPANSTVLTLNAEEVAAFFSTSWQPLWLAAIAL
jgi:hypothetical protein